MTHWSPKLEILPSPQQRLWPRLVDLPRHFVLYGGTALALRLGHRISVDFDFFSSQPFSLESLKCRIPWLAEGRTVQTAPNTLTVIVDVGGAVPVTLLGGLKLCRAGIPDRADGTGVPVASLLDLAATKVHVVQHRAEAKDYLDIAAILNTGMTLERACGAALAVYGSQFNPSVTLKALSYFEDGDLASLPDAVKHQLALAASEVKAIEALTPKATRLVPD